MALFLAQTDANNNNINWLISLHHLLQGHIYFLNLAKENYERGPLLFYSIVCEYIFDLQYLFQFIHTISFKFISTIFRLPTQMNHWILQYTIYCCVMVLMNYSKWLYYTRFARFDLIFLFFNLLLIIIC